ncbi:MAG: ice-binding family protein [Lutibacter sp.]|nr:ice-binding family protein [Lutibacter sp.]MDT8416723.1 ice-binding family protein [Lutibacter sp.]
MIAKKLLTTIAFAFVLLFSGCAEDDFVGVDGLCPLVVSTVPEDGAIDVPLNQVITATFNEKMNPATITKTSFTISANGTLIDGAVSYNGLTATFDPTLALEPDTEYTGTITTMAKDERGNALQENYVWSFTTLPEYLVVVSSNPTIGGITTGGGLFLKGTPVNVTAVPNNGYTFTNWTINGVFASNLPTYTLPPLMGDVTLVANYTLVPYEIKLSVNPINNGTTDGAGFYNFGSTATVKAIANNGYNFVNWTENGVIVPLAGADYSFTVSGPRTLVANFAIKTYTLTVNAVNGTVAKNPNQATYNHGATVVLTPTPAVGYVFTSWSGDATGNNNPLTVTMNSNKVITANFSPIGFTLNVTAVNGTVAKNPNNPTYTNGTNVVLTATPNSGYAFLNWTGDATGNNNPLTVLMNGNKNITANFILIATSAECATPAVDLGMAGNYAILAESAISTTGVTSVTGDMGISPLSASFITGFGLTLHSSGTYSTSSLVTGKIYAADYTAPTPSNLTTTVDNMHTAFTTANGLAPDRTEYLAGNLNNVTLTAGVYKYGTGLLLSNTITLDGGGVDCAAFVFQIAGDLTVANNVKIVLINGAKADNIFWVTAGAGAVIGSDVDFSGNILSKTLISLEARSTVKGRLLAQSAVSLIGNKVVKPSN